MVTTTTLSGTLTHVRPPRTHARGSGGIGTQLAFELRDCAGRQVECTARDKVAEALEPLLQVDRAYSVRAWPSRKRATESSPDMWDVRAVSDVREDDEKKDGGGARAAATPPLLTTTPLSALKAASQGTVGQVLAVLPGRVLRPARVITRQARATCRVCVDLVDAHGTHARLTLWGEHAELLYRQTGGGPCVLLVRAAVNAFGELQTCYRTYVGVDPAWLREARLLKVAAVRSGLLGAPPPPPRLAYVAHVMSDFVSYRACPTCRRKAVEQPNGEFWCERCYAFSAKAPRRLLLSVRLTDVTGTCTVFHAGALELLGWAQADAEERMEELLQTREDDPERYRQFWQALCYADMLEVHVDAERKVSSLRRLTAPQRSEGALRRIRELGLA